MAVIDVRDGRSVLRDLPALESPPVVCAVRRSPHFADHIYSRHIDVFQKLHHVPARKREVVVRAAVLEEVSAGEDTVLRAPVAVASVHRAPPRLHARVEEAVAGARLRLRVGEAELERRQKLADILAPRSKLFFERRTPPALGVGLVKEVADDRAVLERIAVAVPVRLVELPEEPIDRRLVETVHRRKPASARKPRHVHRIGDKPRIDDDLVAVGAERERPLLRLLRCHAGDLVLHPVWRLAALEHLGLDVTTLEFARNREHRAETLARKPIVVVDHRLHAALAAFVDDNTHVTPPGLAHPVVVRTRLERQDALSAFRNHPYVFAQTRLAVRLVHPEERPRVHSRRPLRRGEILAQAGGCVERHESRRSHENRNGKRSSVLGYSARVCLFHREHCTPFPVFPSRGGADF